MMNPTMWKLKRNLKYIHLNKYIRKYIKHKFYKF